MTLRKLYFYCPTSMTTIFSLIFIFFIAILRFEPVFSVVNFFHNDLAKVCRPVDQPLDLLFILDGSGSVESSTFEIQLQMLNRVIDMVDIGEDKTKIAVMQYASYTYIEFLFKTFKDKASIREAIKSINHKLGTTKTGKALDKAIQLFNDPTTGSRRGASSGKRQHIAQVAILVSDGHSHDNPMPAALRLRESGVNLIALGIGQHINSEELLEITGDESLVFQNLDNPREAAHFIENLRMRFALSEACEYSRGIANDGADVACERNGARVSVTTSAPFHGHFYIQGHFHDPKCKWHATVFSNNRTAIDSRSTSSDKTPTNMSNEGGDDLSLFVPFGECGVQQQFSVNPKGIVFETNVVLQFHPNYNTIVDKNFKIYCFYQDKSGERDNGIDWKLIKEHTQRKSKANKKVLPCSMRVTKIEPSLSVVNLSTQNKCDNENLERSNFHVGEPISLHWECNSDNFDIYQSMLVHNCYMIDMHTGDRELLIDKNGCSIIEQLVETPRYGASLMATSRATAFRKPDSTVMRIQCSLRFCDRLMSECDEILPPKCYKNDKESEAEKGGKSFESGVKRYKRQTGVAVSIRSLNDNNNADGTITGAPPLVTFDRNRKSLFKRIRGQQQRVMAVMNSPARLRNIGPTDIRLSTQDVKIVGEPNQLKQIVDVDTKIPENGTEESLKLMESQEKPQESDDDLPPQIARTLKQHGINVVELPDSQNKSSTEDPFQENQRMVDVITEDDDQRNTMVTELDQSILEFIKFNEITIQSQIIRVDNKIYVQTNDKCQRRR